MSEIEKLSADEQYYYGRLAGKGFMEKLVKLSSGEEELPGEGNVPESSGSKKKCPNLKERGW